MKNLKKSLIFNAIILAFSMILFICTTIAYFTDRQEVSSTITAGDVSIVLSEAAVKRDINGNLIEDTDKDRIIGSKDVTKHDYGAIYPGQSIYKDPTITNTGSNNAYIAAKVTIYDGIGDIYKNLGIDGYEDIDINMLISGGLLSQSAHFGTWNGIEDVTYNENFAMIQVPNRSEGKYEFYFFIDKPVEKDKSVKFFEQVSFLSEFTNTEMQEFVDLKIDFWGFGVQTAGFSSCFEAMTTALPEYFDSAANATSH